MVAIVASSASFHAKNASQSVFVAIAAFPCRVSPNLINKSEGLRCAEHSQAPVGIVFSALVKSSCFFSEWSWGWLFVFHKCLERNNLIKHGACLQQVVRQPAGEHDLVGADDLQGGRT